MNMTISKEAAAWFEQEMDVASGDEVQFFVRYGGDANFQKGFSLGLTVKEAEDAAVEVTEKGIRFYVERKDIWYFDDTDFHVDYDQEKEEITFILGD